MRPLAPPAPPLKAGHRRPLPVIAVHCRPGRTVPIIVAVNGADRPRDRELIVSLSGLLPPDSRAVPTELWDVGEEGRAVETLADLLSERRLPLPEDDRLRLLAAAGRWGVGQRVRRAVRWCPDPDAEDQPWSVVEGTEFARTVAAELETEIGRRHPLRGTKLTMLLACNACDDVLVKIDDGTAPPGASLGRYAVVHPTWSGRRERPLWPSTTFYADSLEALDRLESCFD